MINRTGRSRAPTLKLCTMEYDNRYERFTEEWNAMFTPRSGKSVTTRRRTIGAALRLMYDNYGYLGLEEYFNADELSRLIYIDEEYANALAIKRVRPCALESVKCAISELYDKMSKFFE